MTPPHLPARLLQHRGNDAYDAFFIIGRFARRRTHAPVTSKMEQPVISVMVLSRVGTQRTLSGRLLTAENRLHTVRYAADAVNTALAASSEPAIARG